MSFARLVSKRCRSFGSSIGSGGVGIVDAVEPARGEPGLGERALPRGEDVLGVVLARRVVDLVEDVEELVRVRPVDGVPHEVAQRVLHRPRLGVARIEEHQHQVGQVDDVIGDAQRRVALLVGVEPRRVDEDLPSQRFAPAGLELEVGVDPPAFAAGHALDVAADLVEGETRIGIEREAGQGARRLVVAEADDGELVVDRLVSR